MTHTGLGAGDTIYGNPDVADCGTIKTDIQTLIARGASLLAFPNCP